MPVSPPYRNQSIDLLCKSIDWFLYKGKTGINVLNVVKFRNSMIRIVGLINYKTINSRDISRNFQTVLIVIGKENYFTTQTFLTIPPNLCIEHAKLSHLDLLLVQK